MVGDGAGIPVIPVGDPGEGFLRGKIDGVGSSTEFLRSEVDVFSERFTDPLVDGILHQDPVLVFGGVGSAGQVAGQTGSGEPGETGKTVIKEAAAADFFEVWVRHGINLCFREIRSRAKVVQRVS